MATITAGQTDVHRRGKVQDLQLNSETLFSNHKNIYKKSIEKRQTKLMDKIRFIKPFLHEDEEILLITTGCSPASIFEQFVTGWIIFYMKRAIFVFTNKRIFHIPTTANYSYRNSIAQISYADCQSVKLRGRVLTVEYGNGTKEKFIYIAAKERKKIKSLLQTISFKGVRSKTQKRIHLCPKCTKELEEGKYICQNCRLKFKDKDEARKLSIIYPGGGYFYTGHPLLGIGDAVTEIILLLLVALALIDTLKGSQEGGAALLYLSLVLFLEKAISVYHSNHYIKEYIPIDKNIKPTV